MIKQDTTTIQNPKPRDPLPALPPTCMHRVTPTVTSEATLQPPLLGVLKHQHCKTPLSVCHVVGSLFLTGNA